MLASGPVGFWRRHPVLSTLSLIGLLAVGTIAASALAVWRAAHTDEASTIDRADVILVMGAAQYGGEPSPVFRGRLEHGRLLYGKGFADLVLVLGAAKPGDDVSEAEAGVRYLRGHGLPRRGVEALPEGTTTMESLEAAARFMRDEGLRTAFLVSDPWHNLRIRRMARDLGIEGYVSATWHSAARSQSTRLAGYSRETFAYLYYRVFGG